jgi:hypothetical protein
MPIHTADIGPQEPQYWGIFVQSKNCGTRETAIANSSETFISVQRLCEHVPTAADKHATIEVMLETVFFTWSVQRGYKEDNRGDRVSSVWKSVMKRGSWKGHFSV